MESGSESRMSTSINVSLSADIKPATFEENVQVSILHLFISFEYVHIFHS